MCWNNYKVGDRIEYSWNEFDGTGKLRGKIIEVAEDYAIAECDGMKLWIDEDTEYQFRRI